jgi:hypothetical protein
MFVAMILVLCILILPPLVIGWFIPAEAQPDRRGHAGVRSGVPHFGIQFSPHRRSSHRVGLARGVHDLALRPVEEPPAVLKGGCLPRGSSGPTRPACRLSLAAQGVVTTVLALSSPSSPPSGRLLDVHAITTSVYLLMYLWLFGPR